MVSDAEFETILNYSFPYIKQNLQSVDFLNNHVQKVDGKVPFFDDDTRPMQVFPSKGKMPHVKVRPTIHLKDSWSIETSVKNGVGYVYLSNGKRSADGRWIVADLLWYGTSPYQSFLPSVYADVLVSAVPGVGQTQFPGMSQFRKYKTPKPVLQGHQSGKMSFYNRYTGNWNYNRISRRGIRNILVTSFQEYILLCVENGIRTAIELMKNEGILIAKVTDIHVRVAR